MIEITNTIIKTNNGMKKNLDQTKQLVTDNISSIFTKQDVLDILNNIDTRSDIDNIKGMADKIQKEFKYELECIINQIVDKDEVTLELHGNEILVDDVPIDSDIIEKALEDVLETLVADFEEQEEKRTFTS
jgi:hypothetical protein